ncbi:hypothetical protein FE257_004306 [Aspergillus nanangensis]|uniref:Uncharacterized protein n=1 Tax=Aspergillus nanangensis TaxID=2582783 RepID=A0AAD4CC41_ASPNN|nr:hypothetical protein FE257_004306 [Aspergillus nanangensis]
MIFRKLETLLTRWFPYDCDDWIDAALGEAAKHGHRSVVQLLVQQGANINMRDTAGTPLIQAAAAAHGDVVEYLLKEGANVHCTNKYGQTALCAAASAGDLNATKALIEHGAKVNATSPRDEDGDTALLLAAQGGHEKVVECLLSEGANTHHVNNCNATALQLAVDAR